MSEEDETINDTFKPDPQIAKTSLEGRVIYEDVTFTGLTSEQMREAGEFMAREFPGYTVWVTGGPWRGYDVRWQVDSMKKIISLDFYSVRPGFHYLADLVPEIKKAILISEQRRRIRELESQVEAKKSGGG